MKKEETKGREFIEITLSIPLKVYETDLDKAIDIMVQTVSDMDGEELKKVASVKATQVRTENPNPVTFHLIDASDDIWALPLDDRTFVIDQGVGNENYLSLPSPREFERVIDIDNVGVYTKQEDGTNLLVMPNGTKLTYEDGIAPSSLAVKIYKKLRDI